MLRLLAVAADKFAARTEPILSEYSSAEEIAKFVRNCMERIRAGNLDRDGKDELLRIFAPTCDWDDVVGDVELGNQVFSSLTSLYRADVLGNG